MNDTIMTAGCIIIGVALGSLYVLSLGVMLKMCYKAIVDRELTIAAIPALGSLILIGAGMIIVGAVL